MFTQRRRRARDRHPSAIVDDHAMRVEHAEHGSWAYCECGWEGLIRLDAQDAYFDADVHMARALSARLLGPPADALGAAELLERLRAVRIPDGELAAIIDLCWERIELCWSQIDNPAGEASGW